MLRALNPMRLSLKLRPKESRVSADYLVWAVIGTVMTKDLLHENQINPGRNEIFRRQG